MNDEDRKRSRKAAVAGKFEEGKIASKQALLVVVSGRADEFRELEEIRVGITGKWRPKVGT
jgi:hypothetical protein